MATTIQISGELLDKLQNLKIHGRESCGDIIWDLREDSMELQSGQKRYRRVEADIRAERIHKWEDVKNREICKAESGCRWKESESALILL